MTQQLYVVVDKCACVVVLRAFLKPLTIMLKQNLTSS